MTSTNNYWFIRSTIASPDLLGVILKEGKV